MILVLAMSLSNILLAQDSNDPYHDRETEEVVDQDQNELRTYFTEETREDREGHNYYTEVENDDTESPPMLTFNFLLYMVYKLKFSDTVEDDNDDKTTDDD